MVVPIAAVAIGQHLQTRAKIREDKMRVFEAMMTSRVLGMSVDTVRAANLIHVTFARDKEVRRRWSEYYDALCIKDPTEEQLLEVESRQLAMLKAMAASLGYDNDVLEEALDTKYLPKGMVDALAKNQQQQDDYNAAIRLFMDKFSLSQPPSKP